MLFFNKSYGDPNTGQRIWSRAAAKPMFAITYAVGLDDGVLAVNFLNDWYEGNCREWPDYLDEANEKFERLDFWERLTF